MKFKMFRGCILFFIVFVVFFIILIGVITFGAFIEWFRQPAPDDFETQLDSNAVIFNTNAFFDNFGAKNIINTVNIQDHSEANALYKCDSIETVNFANVSSLTEIGAVAFLR